MTTREILIAARKRIEKPGNWCKGLFGCGGAKCAVVTIAHVGGYEMAPTVRRAFTDANPQIPPGNIGGWNDAPERTHAEVLAAFDRAIAATPEPAHDA